MNRRLDSIPRIRIWRTCWDERNGPFATAGWSKVALTWRRDYIDTGDAKRGNSFSFRIAFRNRIGRLISRQIAQHARGNFR